MEHLKVKEFEETGMSLCPSQPFSPATDHKTLMKEVPSLHQEERNLLISEDKGLPRKISQTTLLSFASILHLPHIPSPSTFPHSCRLFVKPSIKIFRSVSCRFISYQRSLWQVKLILNTFVSFSPAYLSLSV